MNLAHEILAKMILRNGVPQGLVKPMSFSQPFLAMIYGSSDTELHGKKSECWISSGSPPVSRDIEVDWDLHSDTCSLFYIFSMQIRSYPPAPDQWAWILGPTGVCKVTRVLCTASFPCRYDLWIWSPTIIRRKQLAYEILARVVSRSKVPWGDTIRCQPRRCWTIFSIRTLSSATWKKLVCNMNGNPVAWHDPNAFRQVTR